MGEERVGEIGLGEGWGGENRGSLGLESWDGGSSVGMMFCFCAYRQGKRGGRRGR